MLENLGHETFDELFRLRITEGLRDSTQIKSVQVCVLQYLLLFFLQDKRWTAFLCMFQAALEPRCKIQTQTLPDIASSHEVKNNG